MRSSAPFGHGAGTVEHVANDGMACLCELAADLVRHTRADGHREKRRLRERTRHASVGEGIFALRHCPDGDTAPEKDERPEKGLGAKRPRTVVARSCAHHAHLTAAP